MYTHFLPENIEQECADKMCFADACIDNLHSTKTKTKQTNIKMNIQIPKTEKQLPI